MLALGVEGIKADDGEGYYLPDDLRSPTGTGAETAWRSAALYRRSMQRALDEVHGPGRGVLFGRSGLERASRRRASCGRATRRRTSGRCACSWPRRSRRPRPASRTGRTTSAATSATRLVERCPKELLLRWAQLGCFTPLMQAHGRLAAGAVDLRPPRRSRSTAATCCCTSCSCPTCAPRRRPRRAPALPIVRPLSLLDPADERGWSLADAFGYGPSLWVAPVLEEGAREREAPLPRGRLDRGVVGRRGRRRRRGRRAGAAARDPRLGARAARSSSRYPAEHVAAGLGDTPERERPLVATLWGEPRRRPRAGAAGRRHARPLEPAGRAGGHAVARRLAAPALGLEHDERQHADAEQRPEDRQRQHRAAHAVARSRPA